MPTASSPKHVPPEPHPQPTLPQPPRTRHLVRKALTLISWYCVSSTIILATKWLFTNHFSFPLTVTAYSNSLTTVWAFLASRHPRFRPEPLTRRQFRDYVLPISIATALEIGFSNLALKLLTVSFGTILKGASPIFTMFWGLLFRVETFSFPLFSALATIAFGITLASVGEGKDFAILGFVLQLLAVLLGGLRWAMTHVLLKGSSSNAMPPLTATLYTSPTTALCVLPFAIGMEGMHVWDRSIELSTEEFAIIAGTMTAVATLVFIVLISEYWLVNATSSLALSVAGVFKELLTIGGGILLLSESVSPLNVVGFCICQVGIFAYIYLRSDASETSPSDPAALPDAEVQPFVDSDALEGAGRTDRDDYVKEEQPTSTTITLGR